MEIYMGRFFENPCFGFFSQNSSCYPSIQFVTLALDLQSQLG
jgi:hypothetical protein